MILIGLTLMAVAMALLLAMVVSALPPGVVLCLISYAIIFAGVFCFAAGVLRRRR